MNSKRTFQTLQTAITIGALALSVMQAQAQVVSTPYGNLPAGAQPVQLSPSAPYTTNRFNHNTQDYSVFGGMNGAAAFPYGVTGLNGIGNGYGGNGFYGFDPTAYFGYGLAPYGYFGTPNGFSNSGYAGNNISVLGSPYGYGGFVTVNPNGSISVVSPDGTYNPFQSPYGFNGDNSASPYGRSGQNNANAQTSNRQPNLPLSLSQQINVQRDNSYGFTFGWRGDPSLLANMTVTLLNRYHLPITSGSAADGSPIAFAGNTKTYAARYYRVDITYADGAVASLMGTVRR